MDNHLAIITVNYENYPVTQEFLSYFKDTHNPHFKIFISDLSTNKKDLVKNEYTEIIQGENKGYAYGINLGLQQAIVSEFQYFAVINNDTRINNDCINSIILSLKQHPSSLIGGKIYYEKGYEYHKDKYQKEDLGKVIWYAGGEVDWKNVYTIHRGVDEVDHAQFDTFEKTEFITGCLMCFDKEVINKIGLWNEKYFLYYEDADYCERAKKAKINLFYDPSIVIYHKNAQSTGGSGSKLHQKYQEKNRFIFGLKYAPLRTKIHLLKNHYQVIPNLFRDLIK